MRTIAAIFVLVAVADVAVAASHAIPVAGSSRLVRRWTTADGLPENSVTAIARAKDGCLWVKTSLGIARFDGVKFTLHMPPDAPEIPWASMETVDLPKLSGYEIRCALAESNGVVWVGTDGDGLLRLRPRLVTSRPAPESGGEGVRFTDSRGHVWTGSDAEGVVETSPDGRQKRYGPAEGLAARHVTSFTETADGDIWIGSDGMGLWRIADGHADHPDVAGLAKNEFIRALFCDSAGAVWIASRGSRIARMENGSVKTMRFVRLASTIAKAFFEEPVGRLWIETDKMLFSFGVEDFVLAADANGVGCRTELFRAADGYVYRPDRRAVISPAAYAGLCALPRPRVLIESPLPTKAFPPDTQEISVAYTADTPGMADRVTFSVRLLPLRKEWRYVQWTRHQTYENLPPGHYQFEVRARLPFGDWGETTVMTFSVAPHFHDTLAFRLLLVGSLLVVTFLVAWAISVSRMRARMAVARRRTLLAAERTRIARDIHDDVGARLTRISLLVDMHGNGSKAAIEIADEVNDMVRALDEVVWAVEPRNDILSAFADYLYHYAEMFFAATELRFRPDIPADLPEAPVTSTVRHEVYLCVKEALNNLVKHAQAKTAYISLSVRGADVSVVVGDDGKGFDGPRAGGNGLANMKSRMARIGGTFAIGRRPGGGCEVSFSFRTGEGDEKL